MITNIFQFLYNKKGKPIPFLIKLLHDIPLTEEDLTIKHELSLDSSKIKYLPDNLTINSSLYIKHLTKKEKKNE